MSAYSSILLSLLVLALLQQPAAADGGQSWFIFLIVAIGLLLLGGGITALAMIVYRRSKPAEQQSTSEGLPAATSRSAAGTASDAAEGTSGRAALPPIDSSGVIVVVYGEHGSRREVELSEYVHNVYHGEGVPEGEEPDKLKGLPIDARVRPRRQLPRRVILNHETGTIEVRFQDDAQVPEADPPPLSPKERRRLEELANRVASPLAYGRATYIHMRSGSCESPSRAGSERGYSPQLGPGATPPSPPALLLSPVASLHGSFCRPGVRPDSFAGTPGRFPVLPPDDENEVLLESSGEFEFDVLRHETVEVA